MKSVPMRWVSTIIRYDLGGNITRLNRSQEWLNHGTIKRMDGLTYTYDNRYRLKKVEDQGKTDSAPNYRHFVDGTNQSEEYLYDASGRVITDKNRNMNFEYNVLGLPRKSLP